jgi:hypothetical protein
VLKKIPKRIQIDKTLPLAKYRGAKLPTPKGPNSTF